MRRGEGNIAAAQSLWNYDTGEDHMVRNFGELDIHVSTIKERPTARNQMGELLKSLILWIRQVSNETMLDNQKTIEIQTALDRI